MRLASRHGRLRFRGTTGRGVDALSGLIQGYRQPRLPRMRQRWSRSKWCWGRAFSAAREVGRGLPLEEVIAEAVALAENLVNAAK